MAMGHNGSKMERDMKENGGRAKQTGMVLSTTKVAIRTRDKLRTTKQMEKEHSNTRMDNSSLVNGLMISKRVKE